MNYKEAKTRTEEDVDWAFETAKKIVTKNGFKKSNITEISALAEVLLRDYEKNKKITKL